MLLPSDELMSCCAEDTNVCLDRRRRAFPLGEQVSAEWSRCPGSMARRARDSVAYCDEAQQVGILQGSEVCPLV